MLKEPDIDITAAAIQSVKQKVFARDVIPFLSHKNPNIRKFAVDALWRLNAKEHAEEIIELMKSDSTAIDSSAELLCRLQVTEYIPDIVKLLEDKNTRIMKNHVNTLST